MEIQFRSKKEEKRHAKQYEKTKKEDINKYLLRIVKDSNSKYYKMIEKEIKDICANFPQEKLLLVEGFLPKSLLTKVIKYFVQTIDGSIFIDEKWLILKTDYEEYVKNNEEWPFEKVRI